MIQTSCETNLLKIAFNTLIFLCLIIVLPSLQAQVSQKGRPLENSKPFLHPGLLQNREDLEFMKKKILSGEQPWKDAYGRLYKSASLDFVPKPFTHVIRGSYGHPAIGGSELTASSNQAYAQAIIWYVTGKKEHAQKAIEILNAWSYKLWDFDENDAKLLASWTGHVFANAAEILRYSNSGWQQKDIEQFKRMLLTVYYPTQKDFFPEANGNWDVAFANSLLCIAIFCDNREIFNATINHLERGEGNGGFTKYIYPTGQCQETTRDQAHTQLGLGELSQAFQVAWTQGYDLYSGADNRLALGLEYTAKYMMGEDVPVYGIISETPRRRFSNIYLSAYQHYHYEVGLEMPYTSRAVDSAKSRSSIDLLTAIRAPFFTSKTKKVIKLKKFDSIQNGALNKPTATPPVGSVIVLPGESIQTILDKHRDKNIWIILAKGVHTLPAPLRLPSNITIAGQGIETILFLDPNVAPAIGRAAIVNANDSLNNVVLRDFVIEGALTTKTSSDPNQDRRQRSTQMVQGRAGISFSAQLDAQMQNLKLENITVRNCTNNGVAIKGAGKVEIKNCDFSDNGGNVAPGQGLLHNLLLTHIIDCVISNNRFDTSLWGSGIDLTFGTNVLIAKNEIARNSLHGIRVMESDNITIVKNLVEGNNGNGIFSDQILNNNHNIKIIDNTIHYNSSFGIEMKQKNANVIKNNIEIGNGKQ